MSEFKLTFIGEMHTLEEEARVDKLIKEGRYLKSKERFLLLEGLDDLEFPFPVDIYKYPGLRLYAGNKKRLRLAQYLRASAIGIDYPSTELSIYRNDVWKDGVAVDLTHSFKLREARMLETVKHYHALGDCVVVVGDTHLRTVASPKDLGPVSPLYEEFKNNRHAEFIRSPVGEIE